MAIAAPFAEIWPEMGEPFYPESDGEPMAESDVHWDATVDCTDALRAFFADRKDVYVASDNFLYFVRGNPRAVVSPDCYVVFGVDSGLRPSYKTWENNDQRPAVVIEFTSKSTRREDTERKFALYRDMLAVPEYILFDPTGDYLPTRLSGYRLTNRGYSRIAPNAEGRLSCLQLGLELWTQNGEMRWFDPTTGTNLPTRQENRERAAQADAALALAQRETRRADEAEAELARLRAELRPNPNPYP